MTGLTFLGVALVPKRLALLKEALRLQRVHDAFVDARQHTVLRTMSDMIKRG